MSRPQAVSIDRLPVRRTHDQPKEAMNCKSCRKRKIKCNRLRPSCEACQIFGSPCVYDAIPKKRGPKTDVLEALLRRVDGLEKRLDHDDDGEKTGAKIAQTILSDAKGTSTSPEEYQLDVPVAEEGATVQIAHQPETAAAPSASHLQGNYIPSPANSTHSMPGHDQANLLLSIYFDRVHGKPYHIFNEASTRRRFLEGRLPSHLSLAIFAITIRYMPDSTSDPQFSSELAGQTAAEYAKQARAELEIDEPSVEALQTLLLLTQVMFQNGAGKKAYTYLSLATTMALAMNLHRELPITTQATALQQECCRRLFWSCYLMDRFAACGSKRPSLIADESISLRLPVYDESNGFDQQANFFPSNAGLQSVVGGANMGLGSYSMLISITRILGTTNRYLAAGGVKGDTHFPWHAMSSLSRIRQDLDAWAADTQTAFSSLEALFGGPDRIIFVMSKLIYHLIHCLIYRPFLPLDLAELERSSQHQTWQIDATSLCFLHANAITELVEIGRASAIGDWPAFVSYCVCTAGTVHVHGAHYNGQLGDVYSMSEEFLSREMQQLAEFQRIWGGIQHQKETLQVLYGAHTELVQSLALNPTRFSLGFQMEDFFDRYSGFDFDAAHITIGPLIKDASSFADMDAQPAASSIPQHMQQQMTQAYQKIDQRPSRNSIPILKSIGPPQKRRATEPHTADPTGSDSFDHAVVMQHTEPYLLTPTEQPQQYFAGIPNGTDQSITSAPLPSQSGGPNFMHIDYSGASHNVASQTHFSTLGQSSFDPMLPISPHQDLSMEMTMSNNMLAPMPGYGYASQNLPMPPDSSMQTDEADPFLALLEQLAENEQSKGGPSDLNFYLTEAS